MKKSQQYGFATLCIHGKKHLDKHEGDRPIRAVSTPIFQSSTFAFESTDQGARRFAGTESGYIYTRMGNPTIAALGLTAFVHATVGEEITSFDYGHYNAYPQGVDPDLPSGGSTDWAGAAPVGQDFPSLGSYSLTPEEIE